MADVDSSPGDPVFFMHHGFIDRNWRIWQEADTANRLYQMNGYTTQNCGTRCQETTLDYELDIHNIIGGATVNDMMDTTGGMLCYVYDY
jgi:tyrosinase